MWTPGICMMDGVPLLGVHVPSSARQLAVLTLGAMKSEVFADGMLAGSVVLVTGGGSGLGRAAAGELARCGASVMLAGRRAEVLAEAAAALGDSVSWVSGDIRRDEDARAVVDACLEHFGRLDVLVNNAGGQYFVPAEAIEAK